MPLNTSSFLLCFPGVLYCIVHKIKDNILFIEKLKNSINDKITICP